MPNRQWLAHSGDVSKGTAKTAKTEESEVLAGNANHRNEVKHYLCLVSLNNDAQLDSIFTQETTPTETQGLVRGTKSAIPISYLEGLNFIQDSN